MTNKNSEAYRKDDPEAAARCLDKAIVHYCSKGNFRRAATHKQNLAELYEVELGDNARAAAAYEEAAGWYESVSPNNFYNTTPTIARMLTYQ
jgi:alpha-soluble NSF attachment protein